MRTIFWEKSPEASIVQKSLYMSSDVYMVMLQTVISNFCFNRRTILRRVTIALVMWAGIKSGLD